MAACLESAPWGLTNRTTVRIMRVTPHAEAEARSRQWGMRQNETVFQNIAVQSRTNRPGLATNQVSHIVSEVSLLCAGSVPPVSPSPQSSSVKRPLLDLPDDPTYGVVNDHPTQARPSGFVRLTNEVQHLVKVLPCEERITNSPLKSGVRWPDYKARDTASANRGKSGSLAIYRL